MVIGIYSSADSEFGVCIERSPKKQTGELGFSCNGGHLGQGEPSHYCSSLLVPWLATRAALARAKDEAVGPFPVGLLLLLVPTELCACQTMNRVDSCPEEDQERLQPKDRNRNMGRA